MHTCQCLFSTSHLSFLHSSLISSPLPPLSSSPLRASFGTTKYCTFFLRGTQCSKPDCMYLHELGEEEASFTKEDMQQG